MQKPEDILKAMGLDVETKVIKEGPEVTVQEVLARVLSLQNVDVYYTKLKG